MLLCGGLGANCCWTMEGGNSVYTMALELNENATTNGLRRSRSSHSRALLGKDLSERIHRNVKRLYYAVPSDPY